MNLTLHTSQHPKGLPEVRKYNDYLDRVYALERMRRDRGCPEYRVRVGLTVRHPWWLWPVWLLACAAIGAAFAWYF